MCIRDRGYTALIEGLLEGSQVRLGVDYLRERPQLRALAPRVIYTGCIDAYFDYCYGPLEYRRVRFDTRHLETPNYQGNAVINYTDAEVPYTRVIEHKHFAFGTQPHTVVSWEYSAAWRPGDEPYYPINDARNQALYARYAARMEQEPGVYCCGRLAQYRYYDMDRAMENAIALAKRLLEEDGAQKQA